MRTENEMFHTIINAAKSDDRVLAAYLKGSRTNPNVPKDIYQDYDIMYVVLLRQTRTFMLRNLQKGNFMDAAMSFSGRFVMSQKGFCGMNSRLQ